MALLERLRAERLHGAAVIFQSRVGRWLVQIRYIRFQQAAVTMQKSLRELWPDGEGRLCVLSLVWQQIPHSYCS